LGVLAAAACVGEDPDTSPSAIDGGSPVAEAGADDTRDVLTADVAAPDSSTEAGIDGASPKGCAAHPDAAFCADFDDGGLPEEGWTSKIVTDGGALTLSTSSSVSPPASLRSTVSGDAHAILQRGMPTQAKRVRVELDVNVSAFSTSASILGQILRLYRNVDYNPSVQLVATAGSLQLIYANASDPDGGGTPSGGSGNLAFPVGVWTHVALEVVFDTPGSIVLSVGGSKLVDLTGLSLSGLGGTGGYTLWVGSTPASGTDHPTVVTDIDDVVVTFP
jgi:hypothetical protein